MTTPQTGMSPATPSAVADPLKIMLAGGGTGGHITPVLAVAHELRQLRPNAQLIYIGERHGKYASLLKDNAAINSSRMIFAGKFRRYHGESLLSKLLDIKTNLLNIRDFFFFLIGFVQSAVLIRREKPDLVFLKGGFTGVPVGLAAALWRVPFVTHDSDILPGLANRLVGRWAKIHATGMPEDFYAYPRETTRYVGVMVGPTFQNVTPELKQQYCQELQIPADAQVLFVTGGSNGSRNLNRAMTEVTPRLLHEYPDLYIVHQVGLGNEATYGPYEHPHLRVQAFVNGVYRYSGAADLIVTRAGATNLAEFGVQGKACIAVPNPLLTGGHQLKNADYLVEQGAVKVVSETSIKQSGQELLNVIKTLLDDSALRMSLGQALQKITPPDAAHRVALVLLETLSKE